MCPLARERRILKSLRDNMLFGIIEPGNGLGWLYELENNMYSDHSTLGRVEGEAGESHWLACFRVRNSKGTERFINREGLTMKSNDTRVIIQ